MVTIHQWLSRADEPRRPDRLIIDLDDPRKLTLEWHVAERGSKIYLDANRIAYAQHAVSPYSPRARDRAPVAAPIHWEELADARLRPDRFTVKNIAARIDSEGDPWKGMGRRAHKLPGS